MADDNYIDDTLTRAERIKKLYDQELKTPMSPDSLKRRRQLSDAYGREAPGEPLRQPMDNPIRGSGS